MADIGDIVGVTGVMNLTRTGELTIKKKVPIANACPLRKVHGL